MFDQLWDMVPEAAKAAIVDARNVCETAWENSLVALAMSDTMHAAEINLAAMEGRLNRIRLRVQYPEALQIALKQFGNMAGLVQEISQIARGTDVNLAEVAELVTESTSRHLEVLAEVYEEVPEEAKDAVEWAMERSFRGYEEITMVLMVG